MRTETSRGAGNTSVLPRRILAGLVDSAVVLGPWYLVMRLVVESFPLTDQRFAQFPEDQARIDEIARGVSRTREVGGTLYVLSGFGLWFALIVSIALLVGSLVVIPLILEGQTIGKKVLSLRTTTLNGDQPTIAHYVGRLLGGVADFFPYFLPGAVGWIVASQDAERQRLGDQLGRTLVVDDHSIPRFKPDNPEPEQDPIDEALEENPETESAEVEIGAMAVGESSRRGELVKVGSGGSSSTDSVESGQLVDATSRTGRSNNSSGSAKPGNDSTDEHEKVEFYYSREQQAPDDEPDEIATAEENPKPDDARIDSKVSSNELPHLRSMLGNDDPANAEADQTNAEFLAYLGAEIESNDAANDPDAFEHVVDPTDEYPDASVIDDVEPLDEAEGAKSDRTERSGPLTLSGLKVALKEYAAETDHPVAPKSLLPEEARKDSRKRQQAAAANKSTTASKAKVDGTAPEWSEEWQAWLSWDQTSKRWLRHDEKSGKWTPIS